MAKLRHHQDLAIQTVAAANEKQQKVARFEFSAKHNLHKARKRADIVAKKNRFENRRTRTLKRLAMKATDKAEILAEEAKDQAQLNGLAGPHLAKGAKHDKDEEPQDAPDEPQDAPEAEEEKPEAEKAEDMAPPEGGKGSEEEDGVAAAAAQEKAQEAEIEKLKAEKKQAEQAAEIEKLKNEVKKAKEEKAPEVKKAKKEKAPEEEKDEEKDEEKAEEEASPE